MKGPSTRSVSQSDRQAGRQAEDPEVCLPGGSRACWIKGLYVRPVAQSLTGLLAWGLEGLPD